MAEVTMTMEEYLQLINGLSSEPAQIPNLTEASPKPKRRSTAYQRRYKANFKKIARRFKLKSGKWKKNGFRSAVRLAHKMSRK
jgi:hypothetical protein